MFRWPDPLALPDEFEKEYGIGIRELSALPPSDAVILAVAHDDYVAGGWELVTRLLRDGQGVVIDVKSVLDRDKKPAGVDLWRL